jgi:membrane protease YdiL (CAAX protease family)
MGRRSAAIDVALYVAAAFAFYGVEALADHAGVYPLPSFAKGGLTLIASLFVVIALQRRHGLGWRELGLRRPRRWWTIPAWGLAIMVVTVIAQLTIVPLLARALGAPEPDLSRYEPIVGNLPLFLVSALGAMFTGGFIEEVIYRGFLIDRLERLLGGHRHAAVGAALSSGVVFGLIHFEWGFGGIVSTAVMGATLGFLFLATRRNLWPLIAAHATMDFILLLQVYLGMFE